jgi:tRNA (guanine37-N1)-methyltransferase
LKIKIISIFPEIFEGFLAQSLIGKAIDKSLIKIDLLNLREFAEPPHFKVDDSPYGGGAGMILKPEPLAKAIEAAKVELPNAKVILLSANGERFNQQFAHGLSSITEIILICGRYEGVDQRVIDLFVDQEISIGDYVLMGGEVAAMVVIETVTRLLSDVIGNPDSLINESFNENKYGKLLEGPQYTRPACFYERSVPEVLLSGDHKKIAEWRLSTSLEKTSKQRPELVNQSHNKSQS